ncbi:AI-2E family transporter [bacterium]|nr:AI-2E family transporter [bacterium]
MPEPPALLNPKALLRDVLNLDLKRLAALLCLLLIVGVLFFALHLIWPVVSLLIQTALPFIVGLIFAYIFDPFVTFAQRKLRISRVGGLVVLYGGFLVAAGAFAAMVLPLLIEQIGNAWIGLSGFVAERLDKIPQLSFLIDKVRAWLEQNGLTVNELASQAAKSEGVQAAARTAASSGARVFTGIIDGVVGFLSTAVGMVSFLIFALLVNVYLLLEFSKLRHVLEVMLPGEHQSRSFDILAKIDVAVGGFIRGTLISACIVGMLTGVGLYFLGLKQYALLIGIVAGFANLIPYLGPAMGGGPAILYILFSGQYGTLKEQLFYVLGVLGLTAVIQVIDGFVLQPRIVGQSAQLHPVAVLFALALGSSFGLLGMIVAVPSACIVRVLLKEFYWDAREAAWHKRTGLERLGDVSPRPQKGTGKKKR